MKRPMVWLGVGAVALVVLVVATAPELLADLGGAGTVAVLAMAAGLPGLFLLALLAITRTGRHDTPGAGRPTPQDGARSLDPEQMRRHRSPDRDPSGPHDLPRGEA